MSQQIIKLPQVINATGLSGSSIYRLITKSQFPKQIKLSERSSGWIKSEIDQWLDDRIEASRGKQEAANDE